MTEKVVLGYIGSWFKKIESGLNLEIGKVENAPKVREVIQILSDNYNRSGQTVFPDPQRKVEWVIDRVVATATITDLARWGVANHALPVVPAENYVSNEFSVDEIMLAHALKLALKANREFSLGAYTNQAAFLAICRDLCKSTDVEYSFQSLCDSGVKYGWLLFDQPNNRYNLQWIPELVG